mgnify:CR=1 FL=1
MKLTLHIGMPSAGGIAIQNYLFSMGTAVSPFVSARGHPELLMLGGTPRALAEYGKRFGPVTPEKIQSVKDSLKSAQTDHVVLSSMMLYDSADSEFVGNLCLELDDIFEEMQVVIYFRHQADDFPQLVAQRVKAGMKDWAHIESIPDDMYRYDQICELWEQDVDLVVRDFGRCKGDVIGDFCNAVGLPAPDEMPLLPVSPSMDEAALRLMVMINGCADPAKDMLRRQIANQLESLRLSDQAYSISPQLELEIVERFEAGNRLISAEYFGGAPLSRESKVPLVPHDLPKARNAH